MEKCSETSHVLHHVTFNDGIRRLNAAEITGPCHLTSIQLPNLMYDASIYQTVGNRVQLRW